MLSQLWSAGSNFATSNNYLVATSNLADLALNFTISRRPRNIPLVQAMLKIQTWISTYVQCGLSERAAPSSDDPSHQVSVSLPS